MWFWRLKRKEKRWANSDTLQVFPYYCSLFANIPFISVKMARNQAANTEILTKHRAGFVCLSNHQCRFCRLHLHLYFTKQTPSINNSPELVEASSYQAHFASLFWSRFVHRHFLFFVFFLRRVDTLPLGGTSVLYPFFYIIKQSSIYFHFKYPLPAIARSSLFEHKPRLFVMQFSTDLRADIIYSLNEFTRVRRVSVSLVPWVRGIHSLLPSWLTVSVPFIVAFSKLVVNLTQ